jgi:hypothetical protein
MRIEGDEALEDAEDTATVSKGINTNLLEVFLREFVDEITSDLVVEELVCLVFEAFDFEYFGQLFFTDLVVGLERKSRWIEPLEETGWCEGCWG